MAIDGVYILLFYVFLFQPRNVVIGERYLEIRDKSLKRLIDDRIFTRILPVMIVSSQTFKSEPCPVTLTWHGMLHDRKEVVVVV